MESLDIKGRPGTLLYAQRAGSDATGAQDLMYLRAPAVEQSERICGLVQGGTAVYIVGHHPSQAEPRWFGPECWFDDLLDWDRPATAVLIESVETAAIKHLFGRFTLGDTCLQTVSSDFSQVFAEDEAAVVTGEAPEEQRSPAYDAFKDLGQWLDATDDEVAEMVGIGRTTPYDWKRVGREPRRSTVRLLFQCHAVLSALVKKLGEPQAKEWLLVEDPKRRERLLSGDIAAIQAETRPIIFGTARPRARRGSWMPDDRTDDPTDE